MIRMTACRLTMVALFVGVLSLMPARAAQPAFPTGSQLGLAPLPGLETNKGFMGFGDAKNKVAILFATLPKNAYGEMEKTMTAESLKKGGIVQESRESFPLALGKAFLIIGYQQVGQEKLHKWLLLAETAEFTALVTVQVPDAARKLYPDDAIRSSLATLAVRANVPDQERLSLVPFKLNDLSGFRIANVLPGRAILLSDAPADKQDDAKQKGALFPRMMIAVVPGQLSPTDDHATIARRVFSTVSGVDELRITNAEPLRIGGQQGYQILATGKDKTSGTEVTIVQWLRFAGAGFLQHIALSPTKEWSQAYTRFRAVRDAVDPR